MSQMNKDIAIEIQNIFQQNELEDLKKFLNKRQCLNTTNTYLIYLFHFVQSAGILTTSIATSKNDENLIWIGVALNILATLIHVYEKTNNSIMKKLMNDIKAIKDGNYVDEGELVDLDKKDDDTTTKSTNDLSKPLLGDPNSSYQTFSQEKTTQF